MPKLNARGQAVCGIGKGIVSVDGTVITTSAGERAWLTEDTILYQQIEDLPGGGERCFLRAYKLPTQTVVDVYRGANRLVAGGGRWAAWLSGVGVFGDAGDRPAAGVLAAGRDGTIALVVDYQAGQDILLVSPGGEIRVVAQDVESVTVLGPACAVWLEHGRARAVGVEAPQLVGKAWNLVYVDDPIKPWVVYWTDHLGLGLIAHPADDPVAGYQVAPQDNERAFNHDAVFTGAGRLRVAYATGQGERPEELRVVDLDLTAPRRSFAVPPPVLKLTATPLVGVAPLTIEAHLEAGHVAQWRWLVDGMIRGTGGFAPAFMLAEGTHTLQVRAQGLDGGVALSSPVTVTVTRAPVVVLPPAPRGWHGVTAGFGGLIGSKTLATLKAKGWQVVRQDGQRATLAELVALVEEIQTARLTPLLLCTVDQVQHVPEGIDVELLDEVDPSKNGLEPNFRVSPEVYAQRLNRVVPLLRERRLRAWGGMVNFDAKALAWLKEVMQTLDPSIGISAHRYPPGDATRWDVSTVGGREVEVANFKAIIQGRSWIVGEWGWNQGPVRTGWQKFVRLFGVDSHSHLTDAQIAHIARSEFAFWHAQGADMAIWYQLNDGVVQCRQHPLYAANYLDGFGLRRADGVWKSVADLWL